MAKPKTFDNKDVSYNKGRSYNLSKGQLKKAGAAKAAKARTVDISGTRRETSGANKGKTLGPGGKPLTGSVKLPSGVTAVYKDGKRVTVSRAKPKPASAPARSTARTTTPRRTTTTTVTVKDKAPKDKGGKPASSTARLGKSYTTTTQTNPQASASSATSARKAAADRAASASGQVPSSSRSYQNGAAVSRASRGDALGLNPATGGTRANPSPYVNSSTQNQRNKGKAPASGASKSKRGGERRTPEQQARDTTRRAVKSLGR